MLISHPPTRRPASNRHHKEPPRKRASTGIITRPSPRGWIRPGLDTTNMASTTWHTVEFSRNRRASSSTLRSSSEAVFSLRSSIYQAFSASLTTVVAVEISDRLPELSTRRCERLWLLFGPNISTRRCERPGRPFGLPDFLPEAVSAVVVRPGPVHLTRRRGRRGLPFGSSSILPAALSDSVVSSRWPCAAGLAIESSSVSVPPCWAGSKNITRVQGPLQIPAR